MTRRCLLWALLACCGTGRYPGEAAPGTTKKVEPTAGSSTEPSSTDPGPDDKPGACVPKDGAGEMWIVENSVAVCYATEPRTCWTVDPATGTFTNKDAAKLRAPDRTNQQVSVDPAGIKVCAPGGDACKTLANKDWKDAARGATNAERTLVAVWAEGGAPMLKVYETKRGRSVYVVTPWPAIDPPNAIQSARFVGDALVVWESYTAISAGARLFVAKSGKKLADVGGKNIAINEGEPIRVDTTKWLFAAFDEQKLFVHDLATGKLAQTIDITDDNPALVGKLPDGRVVANGRRDVRIVDVASGKVTSFSPPACN